MKVVCTVGMSILSRDKSIKGIVTHETQRYCAICKKKHRCYIVKWNNGTCTKPCEKSIEALDDDTLIIK